MTACVRKAYDSVKNIIHLCWRPPSFWGPRLQSAKPIGKSSVEVWNRSLSQMDAPPFQPRIRWIPIHFTLWSDGSPWVNGCHLPSSTICSLMREIPWLFQAWVKQMSFSVVKHFFQVDDRNSSVISGWWQKFLSYFRLTTEIPQLIKYCWGWQGLIFENLWLVGRNLLYSTIHHFCSQQEVL